MMEQHGKILLFLPPSALRELLAHREQLAPREQLDHKELLAHRELQELKGLLVHRELQERREQLVLKVQLDKQHLQTLQLVQT
jgi:hypothetical protein